MRRFLSILFLFCLFVNGCGTVTGTAIWLLSRRGRERRVVLPSGAANVVLYSFDGAQSSVVEVRFNISDPDEDTASVEVCWWDGQEWKSCTSADGVDNPQNIGLTQGGSDYLFRWDARFDLGASAVGSYTVAVFVTDDDATVSDSKDVEVAIGPPSVEILGIEGTSGDIVIFYRLTDAASDPASVDVRFRRETDTDWTPASLASNAPEDTQNLETSDTGVVHTFLWDSLSDLGGYIGNVYIRIVPRDPWDFGGGLEYGPFFVDNNTPPTITITTPSDNDQVAGKVTIEVEIQDEESDLCSVAAWYYDEQSGTWQTAALEGETAQLQSSPTGVSHTFQWDALAAFGSSASGVSTTLLIKVFDAKLGNDASVNLTVDNSSLPSITVDAVPDPATQDVQVDYTVYDSDTPEVDVTFEYSTDGGATWKPGTIKSVDGNSSGYSGNQITGVSASSSGEPHWFIWDSYADEPDKYYDSVIIKLTVYDGANSSYAMSSQFVLNNMVTNDPPTVLIDSPSNGDTVGDLVEVRFSLDDPEGDQMRIEVFMSTDGGTTWKSATLLDSITDGLSSGQHTVFWDTRADALGLDGTLSDVQLKIVPYDPYQQGTEAVVTIDVDNTGWSPPVGLTTSGDNICSVAVAADGNGTAHIFWCIEDNGVYKLYYARGRYDRLTTPEFIANATIVSAACIGNTVYIAYSYDNDIYAGKRNPQTGVWETLNNGAPVLNGVGSTGYTIPDIAVSARSGRISVVARQRKKVGSDWVFYIVETHSDDGGDSWSSPTQLADLSSDYTTRISSCFDSDDTLHVVYDVYVALSTDFFVFYVNMDSSGLLSSPEKIGDSSTYDREYSPDIAYFSGSDKICAVWHAEEGATQRIVRRERTGGNWGDVEEVPDSVFVYADLPSCTYSADRFCVVWEARTGLNVDIYSHEYEGSSWLSRYNVSNNLNVSDLPAIASDAFGNFHVGWADTDSSGAPVVFYALR